MYLCMYAFVCVGIYIKIFISVVMDTDMKMILVDLTFVLCSKFVDLFYHNEFN